MKLRIVALAGVALAALSSPASAGTGWYLGIGAGISNIDPVRYQKSTPALSVAGDHQTSAVFAGSVGYKFDGFVRLESEIAYSSHDIAASTGAVGSTDVKTTMINLVADIPVYSNWTFSAGAGIGAGAVGTDIRIGAFTFVNGEKTGLAWQAIAGVTIPVSENVDLFVDYRYRNVELNQGYRSSYVSFTPITVRGVHESNVFAGLRFYPGFLNE